jgi:hypothetical protein
MEEIRRHENFRWNRVGESLTESLVRVRKK